MALSHIALHLALCNAAAARVGQQADLPVHVVVTDRIHRDTLDQTFHVTRYEGENSSIEFDIPWGIYRMAVQTRVKNVACSAVQYFTVLPDHTRTLQVQLQDGARTVSRVPTIVFGSAPLAFSYVNPTVMVFPKSTTCNGPIGNPLNVDIHQVSDSDGFYADVYPSVALMQSGFVLAVRMTDSQGGYHYIRVPAKFLGISQRWPSTGEVDINDGFIDLVAGKPEDTLLCPKTYSTEIQD